MPIREILRPTVVRTMRAFSGPARTARGGARLTRAVDGVPSAGTRIARRTTRKTACAAKFLTKKP